MKKVIYLIGILFLSTVLILNLIFTTELDASECTTTVFNNFIYIIFVVVLAILICFVAKIINENLYKDDSEKKQKIRKHLFITTLIIYILFNIIWVLVVNPKVVGDSVHVCNLAQTFYRGNFEEFLPNLTYLGIPLREYMQVYPHQISLAFVYSIFFSIIHFDIMEVLRILNIIGNIAIVIALYKINNQLSKKYKNNKVLLLTLILTFLSLPILLTFIYGDIPSLALCLFAVYFMMKYTETQNIKYPIFASIFTMVAYMMRMNSLIFIIATVIYLTLNLLKDFSTKECKKNVLNIMVLVAYIAISIMPASLIKNYYFAKFNLDKNKTYPIISYFLMGMEESPRGNGWYNESIAEAAINNPENIKDQYRQGIKERIIYFSENIDYTLNFYIMKIASMWTENTYSAVRTNNVKENEPMENIIEPLTFYQKTLLILICMCSLIVLIQNRKNLSIDVLFLITIFIGGFAFHLIWEAKSRYIIPYIVVLIPIASINIKKFNIKKHCK